MTTEIERALDKARQRRERITAALDDYIDAAGMAELAGRAWTVPEVDAGGQMRLPVLIGALDDETVDDLVERFTRWADRKRLEHEVTTS